jgi:hypothetical protein
MDQKQFARLGGLARAKKHSQEEIQKWSSEGGKRSAESKRKAKALQAPKKKAKRKKPPKGSAAN